MHQFQHGESSRDALRTLAAFLRVRNLAIVVSKRIAFRTHVRTAATRAAGPASGASSLTYHQRSSPPRCHINISRRDWNLAKLKFTL